MAPKVLEKLPGFSQGVRPSAALRDVILAQPICPKSQIRGKIVNGNYEPPEIGPGDENCQLMGGEWWLECEAKGHDPYFQHVRVYHTVDIEETDADGNVFVVGTKKRVVQAKRLNVTSISPDIMQNSGMGVARKIKYLGFKQLKDVGYEEVCQFRACQKPIVYKAEGLGGYCSLEHLNLIAARDERVFLTQENVNGLNAGGEQHSAAKRRKELRESMPRNVEKVS